MIENVKKRLGGNKISYKNLHRLAPLLDEKGGRKRREGEVRAGGL